MFADPYYKARSERTDEAERLLIPPFRHVFNNADEAQEADDERLVRGLETLPYTHEEAQTRWEESNGID